VAVVADVTALVEAVKVAVLLPAATVTEDGTVTDALLLESATSIPPEGAATVSVTVPVADVPPVTLVGLSASDDSATVAVGFTVSPAVLLTD
jgi:hypothetical protein